MKKIFKSRKFKLHNKRRSQRALEKLSQKRRVNVDSIKPSRKKVARKVYGRNTQRTAFRRPLRQTVNIIAPSNMGIVSNSNETLQFFAELEESLNGGKSVHINLSKVQKLTPDAILYLLALVDVYSQQRKGEVGGSLPDDSDCRDLLRASGFYNFVQTSDPVIRSNSKILSIKSGDIVDPKMAYDVIKFSLARLKQDTSISSKRIYSNLLECMGNTKQHAYEDNLPYKPRWWLMAVFDESKGVVNFSILDYGQGIPTTVRKNVIERLTEFAGYERHL
jgi:hypothetical protein